MLTVVISGGGPTGVELAGGLAELFGNVFRRDYPNLDLRRARIVVVEKADRLLGTFAPRLSTRAYRTLTSRGVEVMLGVGVDKVEPGAVHLSSGARIEAATPRRGRPVSTPARWRPVCDHHGPGGRMVVHPDLSLPGHPEVFAVGDIASMEGDPRCRAWPRWPSRAAGTPGG